MATDWLERLFQVTSVFGRTGAIVGQLGDYAASLISYANGSSGLSATTVQAALDEVATGTGRKQAYNEIDAANLSGTYPALSINTFSARSSVSLSAVNLGSATIQGIQAPTSDVNGLVKLIRLPFSPTAPVTLVNNSGSAAAGNKIITGDGADITNLQAAPGDTYVLLTRHNGNWFAQRLGNTQLAFGSSVQALNTTAPTANQVLVSTGTTVQGVNPSIANLDRLSPVNLSTLVISFATSQRRTWNGASTPAFTYSGTSAVDGAVFTIFFPIGSIASFTLSSDLDPTGAIAGTYNAARAALLRFTYYSSGPCVVTQLFQVTDLP